MSRAALRRHGATGVLVLCLLVLAASVVVSRSGVRLVTVQTGSMAPDLPAGTLLVEEHRSLAELQAGAVITFHAPTLEAPVITHRVVGVERGDGRTVVRTRGDANPGEDPWRAELLGDRVWVVTAGVPGAGTVVDALRSPPALVVVSVLLPAVFVVATLRRIWRRPARSRRAGRWAAARTGVLLLATATVAVLTGHPGPAAAAFTAGVSGGHAVSTVSLVGATAVTLQDACVVSSSAVDVSWTAVDSGQSGWLVERRTGALPSWTTLATAAADARTYRDADVVNLVQYTYRITAVRGPWSSASRTSGSLTLSGTCGGA